MNKSLERQIKKHIENTDALPDNVKELIKVINESYEHYERQQDLLEHSIEVASSELILLNEKLKKEADELRLKEKHLNTSQQIALIGSWEYNEQTHELHWSDETYRICGFEPNTIDVTRELFDSIIHPDDLEKFNDSVETAKSNLSSFSIIHRLKNGKTVHERAEIIYDDQGNPLKRIGTIQDITERINADIALRNSERKFHALIQNSADVLMVLDTNSKILFVSNSVKNITGFSVKEIIQSNAFNMVHPDDVEQLKSRFSQVTKRNGNSFTAQYRRLKKDGNYIWCEGTALNLIEDPAINGVVINFRDITERKNNENALKYSERKLKALIENSSEAIIVVNEKLLITYVSESLYSVAGYTPDDILGLPILELAHLDEVEMITEFMDEVINSPRKPKTLIYKTRRKDGTYIWCERVTTNLLNDPAIGGIVSNFRDITERKESEEAIKLSNTELQKRNTELDKFVYSVSHDLRAPLTSILGLIGISKMCETKEELLTNLEMIRTSTEKLDCFIFDILNYSKNSRTDVNSEPLDFDKLLSEVIENLKYMNSNTTNVQITKTITQTTNFYSDNYRLSIILNNIISNAIKYSRDDDDNPYVNISVVVNKRYAEIIVKDNGIGISEEYHSKIFDMFFRATSSAMGSGLGLYIVREALNRIDGTITFKSALHKGTTFNISIPNKDLEQIAQ